MPRPKNKAQLEDLSSLNFEKLEEFIESMDPTEQEAEFPEGTMNRNIRDVLAHLYHWHLMMMSWYEQGMQGIKPEMPAPGYTWKTAPELNREIWIKYSDTPLSEVKRWLHDSHLKVCSLIARHSDEELFEKKRYPWTGSTSLGAYLISATSSHYDWALKLIKKAQKKSLITSPTFER